MMCYKRGVAFLSTTDVYKLRLKYIAVADEKYSYHIFLTPISSWIFSVFPYFMGLCAHFQSIDHFPISRLIFVYLGIFIPPNGLNIGLKWTIFSSLDH